MKYSKITIFLGVYLLGWGLLISIYLGAIFPFLTTILLVLVFDRLVEKFSQWKLENIRNKHCLSEILLADFNTTLENFQGELVLLKNKLIFFCNQHPQIIIPFERVRHIEFCKPVIDDNVKISKEKDYFVKMITDTLMEEVACLKIFTEHNCHSFIVSSRYIWYKKLSSFFKCKIAH